MSAILWLVLISFVGALTGYTIFEVYFYLANKK